MSVLIESMEMPKNEPLLVKINPDGSVSTTAKNGYRKYKAVPVTEHGRAIDADAFIKRMNELVRQAETDGFDLGAAWYTAFIRHIELAPTIIQADPAEEGE